MRMQLVPVLAAIGILLSALGAAAEDSAEEYLRQGFKAGLEREWVSAVYLYSRSIETDPNNPDAWFQRAVAHEMTGKLEKAAADYVRAIELKPDYYLAYEYLAKVHERRGDYESAVIAYERALPLARNAKWKSIVRHWLKSAQKELKAQKKAARKSSAVESPAR